jgi:hypothetical protein
MRPFIRLSLALLSALVFGLAGATLAAAQDANTRVIVPEAPGGALVAGCYRPTGNIYGSYRFEFCLERRGTYKVTGRGANCNGRLDWSVSKAGIAVQLQRASCGNGQAWTGDSMTCRPNGILGAILGKVLRPDDKVVLGGLRCDYRPVRGSGERPINFVARRVG